MQISKKNTSVLYNPRNIAFSGNSEQSKEKLSENKIKDKKSTHELYLELLAIMKKSLLENKSEIESQKKYHFKALNVSEQNDKIYAENSLSPVMRRFEGDYKDTKAFSKYLADKMSAMICNPTPEEISATIKNISLRTGADEKTATEVLGRLTQFSGYNSLSDLEAEFAEEKISMIDPASNILKFDVNSSPTTNDALLYLQEKKLQIRLDGFNDLGMIIDEALIEDARALKASCSDKLDIIKSPIKNNDARVVIIEGLYVKPGDKNVGQSIFGSSVSPEDAAVEVIKKMQKENISIDLALNEEAVEAVDEIFGNNTDITIITTADRQKFTPERIAKNMSSPSPDENKIRAVIDTLIENELLYAPKDVKDKGRELLSMYFDEMLLLFSPATLSSELKELHSKIEKALQESGKTIDDAVYLIPAKEKSFDVIALQYSKVNDIPGEKFLYYDGRTRLLNPLPNGEKPDLKGKTAVLIDDICGSGDSMLYNEFSYEGFSNNFGRECDVIFAPISALKFGINQIEKEISGREKEHDTVVTNHVVDIGNLKKKMSFEDFNLLSKLLGSRGYQEGYACTGMPYMLPDNNSAASGLMLSHLLRYENRHSNKNEDYIEEYGAEVEQTAKRYAQDNKI